jgi:hypothetical protein
MFLGIALYGLLVFACSFGLAKYYGGKTATCMVLMAWGSLLFGIAIG